MAGKRLQAIKHMASALGDTSTLRASTHLVDEDVVPLQLVVHGGANLLEVP